MPFDLSVIGQRSRTYTHTYTFKDVALYALSVGATTEELPYVYEAAGPRVLPTYVVIPTFEPCRELLGRLAGGFDGLVHRYQSLRIHGELACKGRFETSGEIIDVIDRGSMAEVLGRTWVHEGTGQLIAETGFSVIYLNGGAQGRRGGERRQKYVPPKRAKDFSCREATARNQALLYRWTGDDNPIHLDPEVARHAGFQAPILHGLCTLGFVCRALMRLCADRALPILRELHAEFRKPAYPGDTLAMDGWFGEDRSELIMHVSTVERPQETVLQSVRALLR